MLPVHHGPVYAATSNRAGRLLVLLLALSAALPIGPAAAQQAGPDARQASFDRSVVRGSSDPFVPGSPDPAQTVARSGDRPQREAVRFRRQSPQIGDQIEQKMSIELRMTMTERHGMELTGQTRSVMRNAQRRVITTRDVAEGLATAVKLRYVTATRQTSRSQDSSEPAADETAPERQPVEGKVYECRRTADALIITDARGDVPPFEEYEIVAQHMEMLGRASPLADFLIGRTIYVGQRVSLPAEVAERLLGMGDRFGQVTRFDLTLTGTTTEAGATCAVFEADVEAASNGSAQMRLEVSGPMVVQTDSCRAVCIELSGPIGLSETRGSYSTKYYLIGTGSLAVNLQSAYHDVRR